MKKQAVSTQWENTRYEMSPQEARNVKILRAREGFYQRELKPSKIADIVKELKKLGASNYAEVMIANVNGVLQCVDGQHRLLAHVEAGLPVPVKVMTMTQEQAFFMFCRENGKHSALRRVELVGSSPVPAAKTIRGLANDYNASLAQVCALMIGIRGGSSIGDLHDASFAYTDPEIRAAAEILRAWTNHKLWIRWNRPMTPEERSNYKRHRGSSEAAYSSYCTLFCLGRTAKANLTNLNQVRRDLRLIQDSDWIKNTQSSLRGLQGTDAKSKKSLLDFISRTILLPAYKQSKK